MKYFQILTFLIFVQNCKTQSLPELIPVIEQTFLCDSEEVGNWENAVENYSLIENGIIEYPTGLTDFEVRMIDSLEMGEGPFTETVSCSWYCGGGPIKISRNSEEDSIIQKIHDFNLLSASKITEDNTKVNFHFEPLSPRVNAISIWNGNQKSSTLWSNYSRLSKAKLLVDNKPIAILKFQDTHNKQTFNFEPVQSKDSTINLVISLEVLETYEGDSSKDLFISEINFDGLDVHCFGSGTQILMFDGTTKNIENIRDGDLIKSYDPFQDQLTNSQVSNLISTKPKQLYELVFQDRTIRITDDHPILNSSNKWVSLNPDKSNINYIFDDPIFKLRIGSEFFLPKERKFIKLLDVKTIDKKQNTYTIELKTNNSFIADGISAKVELINKIE